MTLVQVTRRQLVRAALMLCAPVILGCRWVAKVPDQTYLGASYNWAFRARFREPDRLFNAFDYGHAILYERLIRSRGTVDVQQIDGREFTFITTNVLLHPPALPLEERAIAPTYTTYVPELSGVFDWAHMLHRQIYDVLADAKLDSTARAGHVAQLIRYYRSRSDLALSTTPKSMQLMEGAPYSLVFRRTYPRFNGLLWAYHWYQMVLYDALIATTDSRGQDRNVQAATAHFWTLIADAPSRMPTIMPLAAAVSPRFAERFPDAAIIFDNLHSLHDVVSDILSSPTVPFGDKRTTILRALQSFQDSTTEVTTRDEWRAMARDMGAERMGGLAPLPGAQPN